MLEWLWDNLWVTWVGIAVILAVLEMLSLDLVLLMFSFAALVAAASAGVSDSIIVSLALFAVSAVALLWFARPPMVARLHAGPTLVQGHDALVGRVAVVTEPVGEFGGRVRLASEIWSARTDDGQTIDQGRQALVTRIDGATAVVEPHVPDAVADSGADDSTPTDHPA